MTTSKNTRFRLSLCLAGLLIALGGCTKDDEPDPHAGHSMDSGTMDAPAETTAMSGMSHGSDTSDPVADAADTVVLIEPSVIQTIGVRTREVTVSSLNRIIQSTARFEMDESSAHTVTLRTGGWVERLFVTYEGALVREGDPLLDLYSPELVSTQEEYLLALNNAERMSDGTIESLSKDAERLLEAARRRLLYWDIMQEQIDELERTRKPLRTIRFNAPASGEVMSKSVVEGQHVTAGEPLLKIYDTSEIWLMADLYEQDLSWVREGLPVTIELPYDPGKTFTGRVDHIYYMLDPTTRTARARIVMPGNRRTLKPGMYATVRIQGEPLPPAPIVPEESVIRTGEQDVVIIALGNGRFVPRAIRLGVLADGSYRVLEGLEGGEIVVTRAQFLIDSESRLKSAVGAMAGHHH